MLLRSASKCVAALNAKTLFSPSHRICFHSPLAGAFGSIAALCTRFRKPMSHEGITFMPYSSAQIHSDNAGLERHPAEICPVCAKPLSNDLYLLNRHLDKCVSGQVSDRKKKQLLSSHTTTSKHCPRQGEAAADLHHWHPKRVQYYDMGTKKGEGEKEEATFGQANFEQSFKYEATALHNFGQLIHGRNQDMKLLTLKQQELVTSYTEMSAPAKKLFLRLYLLHCQRRIQRIKLGNWELTKRQGESQSRDLYRLFQAGLVTGLPAKLSPEALVLMRRTEVMFFGKGHLLLGNFLKQDLAKLPYPDYRCSTGQKLFRDKSAFLAYEAAAKTVNAFSRATAHCERAGSRSSPEADQCLRKLASAIEAETGPGLQEGVLKLGYSRRFSAAWMYASAGSKCIEYMERNGNHDQANHLLKSLLGLHTEHRIWNALLGLLMWDAIYSDVPDVFYTPFQKVPLDWLTPSFYPARKEVFEGILQQIREGQAPAIIQQRYPMHRESEFKWAKYDINELMKIAECLGGERLAAICSLLSRSVSNWRGMPDLLLWHQGRREVMLLEVKAPRDKPTWAQKAWLNSFTDLGVTGGILRVVHSGHCSAM